MDTVSGEVSTRDLRTELADVLGRAAYGHERVAITRHGKITAIVIGVDDLESLEAFEMERDVAELRAAKAADDGQRITLSELVEELETVEPGG